MIQSNEVRTLEEVFIKVKELEGSSEDFLGVKRSDLIGYLPFEQAKPYLKEDVTSEYWNPSKLSRDKIVKEMLDYMEFAWEKANNCRGLSAGRSINHYEIWLWLLKDELGEKLDGIYEYYGKPCLRAICEKYGWDWKKWDDGEWRNHEEGPALQPQEAPGE